MGGRMDGTGSPVTTIPTPISFDVDGADIGDGRSQIPTIFHILHLGYGLFHTTNYKENLHWVT